MPVFSEPIAPAIVPIRLRQPKISRHQDSGHRPIRHYPGEIVLCEESQAAALVRLGHARHLPESFATTALSQFGVVPALDNPERVAIIAESVGITLEDYRAALDYFNQMETLEASRMPVAQQPHIPAPRFTIDDILMAAEAGVKLAAKATSAAVA